MAVATTAMKNALCTAYAQTGLWLSLHTANPGSTGASEAAGNGYARKQPAWGAPAGGVVSAPEQEFDAGAGAYSHWGLWSAQSGGTFLDGGALTSTVTLSAPAKVKAPISYTQS